MKSALGAVSVIIITRDRPAMLDTCLAALARQATKPNEIIIVNNSLKKNTTSVLSRFKEKLSIRSVHVSARNFPVLYNKGARLSNDDIIAFLDDDCIPRKDWVANIRRAHRNHPGCIIQGKVLSIPKKNLYVFLMSQHYRNWLTTHRLSDGKLSVLDTKNVSFDRRLLLQNLFNEALYLGSHDIELGKRLAAQNIPILYNPTIVVSHHERSNLIEFILQHWRIARSEAFLDRKFPTFKTGMLVTKKNYLTLTWGLRYCIFLIGRSPLTALKVFMVYILLFIVRITGYGYEYSRILIKS